MIRIGLMVLGVTAAMEFRTVLGSTGEASSDWARDYQRAARQFANLMLAASAVIGVPLMVGGAAVLAGATVGVGWALAALTAVPGAGVLRWLWQRWPRRRLDGSFWDENARVGRKGRRHGLVVITACLVFTLVCGMLLVLSN
jgi:hypothetical protein